VSLDVVELCTGAGGQALGLEQAGFEPVVCVENDPDACATLRANRPAWKIYEGDIREFDATAYQGIDLIAGGVPCQPFSVAGDQLGEADERNLFPEALRIIGEASPRAVMLENVKGLGSPKFDAFRDQVLGFLNVRGYVAWWNLELASAHGVPQLRPRMILVALKWPWASSFCWPSDPVTPPTAGLALYDLMKANEWPGAAHWALERCTTIAPTLVGGSKKHGGPDLGPTRAREAWAKLGVNGSSIALEAPGPLHPIDHTPRLTVAMGARLQGFPDDWEITGTKTARWRQVGNAFPPPVARDLGAAIRTALGG
jgi:DNA (cytosine-5)-methyltransferase 1